MSLVPIQLPDALRQLPPLPQALLRALQITRDPGSRRRDLAEVLSLDQALTGHFLRMVNSAYYGLPRRIGSLEEAIAYLGFETVQKTVVSLAARDWLTRPLPAYLLEPGSLWRHSVAVAVGSAQIAQWRGWAPVSEAYVAGLFHDVGKLVLDLLLDSEPNWEGAPTGCPELDWTEVESRLLGHHHAQIGAAVLSGWNLPDRLIEAVAWHHAPSRAETAPQLAAVVHVANTAARMAGIGLGLDALRYSLDEVAIRALSWCQEDMMDLVEMMPAAVEEAEHLLGLSHMANRN